MLVAFILILSISLQTTASVMAVLTCWKIKKKSYWWLMPIAFIYMAGRRLINLIVHFESNMNISTLPAIELVALLISIILVSFSVLLYRDVRNGELRYGS